MLRGYRLLFIALAGLALAGVNQPDQGRAPSSPAANAQQQVSETPQVEASAQRTRAPTPAPNLAECAPGPTYYDCEDLKAQQAMATWTRYMGIAAIVGVILSLVGIWLVYTTFDETRKSNTIAKQNAEAAQREAQASRDALILAERAIVRLGSSSFRQASEDSRSWPLIFTIKNEGRSNAHKFRVDYTISDKPNWVWEMTEFRNIAQLCRPNNQAELEFQIKAPKRFPSYIMGYISYHTIHDAMFKAFFCRSITGPPVKRDAYGALEHGYLAERECQGLPRDT